MLFRSLDANGQGDVTTVIAAIQYAVAKKSSLGIDIINLSLGHPVYEPAATDPLVQAVEAAVRAGIAVVVSAGNNGLMLDGSGLPGYGGINSPANAPSAITVGATDTAGTADRRDDVVATFSSRGPTPYDNTVKPDLVAPGRRLVAAIPQTTTLAATLADRLICVKDCSSTTSPRYLALSGTSMSAAVVSGTAAAVLKANRSTGTSTSVRLTPAALTSAFGLAGAQASGLMEMYGPSMQKRFNPGPAARNGVTAAAMAHFGFTGADTIFEGERGFLRAFTDHFDASALTAGFDKPYQLDIEFKPYSCARPIHNAIDCALEIRKKHAPKLDDIKHIAMARHPDWAHYHKKIGRAHV